jgi:phosphoglycolate phosphatase
LRAEKLLPTELLYIGDEIRDLTACRNVGIPFIAVSWGKDHPDLFRDAGIKEIAATTQELFRMIRHQIFGTET